MVLMSIIIGSIFLTAFYGFLTCGEYTTSSDTFDPQHDFTISDLTINTHMSTLHLKHSKTDRMSKGPSIISQTNTAFVLYPL